MNKLLLVLILLFGMLAFPMPGSAQMLGQAQEMLGNSGMLGSNTEVSQGEEPPLELPPIPQAQPQQGAPAMPDGSVAYFPALPPSRLCKPRDLLGMWKLMMVHESPAGAEISDFSDSPFQYYIFNKNSTLSAYKASDEEGSDAKVFTKMKKTKSGVLEQYVMHESGILYMYKDGVAVNSYACFIVTNKLEPFTVGQMLLMPPPDRATVRMAKAYQKVFGAPKPAAKPKKKGAKNNKNAKKNRGR